MDFRWAITQLMDGNKIRQDGWVTNSKHYWFMGDAYIESSQFGKVTLIRAYITATDWTLFVEPKETLSDRTFHDDYGDEAINVRHIKQFIEEVKTVILDEETNVKYINKIHKKIDELAGNKLIW